MLSASEIPISSVIEFANDIDKLSELHSLPSRIMKNFSQQFSGYC